MGYFLHVPYLIPAALFLLLTAILVAKANRAATKLKMFNAPSRTQLSAQGVENAYSVTRMFWGWADVVGMKVGPTHLLIYASANTFVIVPRRALQSDADYERFAEFAQAQWRNAQPAVPPIAVA